MKIRNYYNQDLDRFKVGVSWDNFVNREDILKMLESPICSYCAREISKDWQLDRIDNSLPHYRSNVTLCCAH
jgi:hypothetical protein